MSESRGTEPISETERKLFDWRSSKEEGSNEEVLEHPFEASIKYIEKNLKQYLRTNKNP